MGQLIENLDFSKYTLEDAINNSALNAFAKSPAHYKRYLMRLDDKGDTPSLQLGRAVHTLSLEPDKFHAMFVKGPDARRNSNDWKAVVQANIGKEVLKPDEYDEVFEIAASIRTNKDVSPFLAEGMAELTVLWVDKETGFRCKGRLDWYTPKYKAIIDIKTTTDASPTGFAYSLEDYKYRRQAAWYIEGAKRAGLEVENFYFIAVEKTAPYFVGFYEVDHELLHYSKLENRELLKSLKAFTKADYWPGYTDGGAQKISVPEHHKRRLEEKYGQSL